MQTHDAVESIKQSFVNLIIYDEALTASLTGNTTNRGTD